MYIFFLGILNIKYSIRLLLNDDLSIQMINLSIINHNKLMPEQMVADKLILV